MPLSDIVYHMYLLGSTCLGLPNVKSLTPATTEIRKAMQHVENMVVWGSDVN